MTLPTLRAQIVECLAKVGVADASALDDHAPLPLDSMAVLDLHNELEIRFDLRLPAREVLPENFTTIAALAAWLGPKLEAKG